METLETLLSQQTIERLGWTLIHFVWQAMAVALLLAVVLRCLRRARPGVRYIVSCLALILIVALPLVTMQLIEVSRPVAEVGPTLDVAPMADPTAIEVIEVADLPVEPVNAPVLEISPEMIRVPWTQRVATTLEPALPWLVLGWLLGVFGLSTWHLGGWAQLQRMRRRMVRDVAAPLHARLTDLSNRLGIRRTVALLESALVDVPTVVGWIKPVILLPASVLSGLSAEQLEAILAHELAHVRRYDYLVNIGQTVIEILGFYHPAVWWISHRIRDERENRCDDLAVEICGDSRRYARALTCLEELRHRGTELAVAANGGSLVARVGRLLGCPTVDNRRFAWLPGLIALLVIVAILVPAALVLAGPNAPMPVDRVESEPNALGVTNERPTIEATMQAPTDGEQADPMQILVRFKVFPEVVADKALDRETHQLVGEILAADLPQAQEKIASRQSITLSDVLRTWVAGRLLTPDTLEVLVDVLQSRGYLDGEATPELLAVNNRQSTITIGTEEPSRDAADPAAFKPVELGTFARVTPRVSSPTSDRITLEIGVEWKDRIGPPDPNDHPTIRSTEIASTVTVLKDHYFTLLAEPDGTSSDEFHLAMFRADLFQPESAHRNAAAPPVPPSHNLPRQVVLDVQTVRVEKGSLAGLVAWAQPQTGQRPAGIEMGYTPDKAFADALRTHLDDLYAQGLAHRLAAQQLTTQDGHEARFKAIKEEWFSLTPTQTEETPEPEPEHTSIASGTVITVKPTIGDTNNITLYLSIEFSESTPKGEGLDLPIVTRRTARSSVIIKDGGTVILAGLSSLNSDSPKNLVILVTAHTAPETEPSVEQDLTLPESPPPAAPPAGRVPSASLPQAAGTGFLSFSSNEGRRQGNRLLFPGAKMTFVMGQEEYRITAARAEVPSDPATEILTPGDLHLLDDVVIEIAPIDANANAVCTLYLDEATFFIETMRLTSSGPVRLVSGNIELHGQGLQLFCKEPQAPSDRSQLTIIDGVDVQITPSGCLIVHGRMTEASPTSQPENAKNRIEPEQHTDARREHITGDATVDELTRKIAEIEVELVEAQQKLSPQHPEIVQKKQLLEALNRRLEERRAELSRTPSGSRAVSSPPAKSETPASSQPTQVRVQGDANNVTTARGGHHILLVLTVVQVAAEARLDRETAEVASEMLSARDDSNTTSATWSPNRLRRDTVRQLLETLSAQVSADRFKAFITLLHSRGYVTPLMEPHMMVEEGQPATLGIGDKNAFTVLAKTADNDSAVRLNLNLDLDLKARTLDPTAKDGTPAGVQSIQTQLNLLVKDGSSTVQRLGGIVPSIPNSEDQGTFYVVARAEILPTRGPARVTATFDGTSLIDAIAEIGRQAGVEIAIDATVKPIPVAAELNNLPVFEAIRTVLRGTGYVFRLRPQNGLNLVFRPISATFQGTDLREALEEVAQQAQVDIMCNFAISGEAWAQFDSVPVETTLRTLLAGSPFTMEITPGTCPVTERKAQRLDADAPEVRIYSRVTATFDGEDLGRALQTVAEMAGANLMYDPAISGEVYATLDHASIETALRTILAGSPYVVTATPDGYAITERSVPPPAAPSQKVDAVGVEARFVLVDRECMEAMQHGLPIKGITAPVDVNALHTLGDDLTEGQTPLLEADQVQLLLKAVRQYTESKALAAPKVTVLDGESASVSLNEQVHYISGYHEPNEPSTEPIPQQESRDIGVTFDATPRIIKNQNSIRLQFEMEITSLLSMQEALYEGEYKYDVPTFTTVTTDTEITIPDGQTALIHIGEIRSLGSILHNESQSAGPMLLLIKPTRTTVKPPEQVP